MSKHRVFNIVVISLMAMGCSGATKPVNRTSSPLAVVSIDTATAISGTTAAMRLRLERNPDGGTALDSLGGFEFLLCYDNQLLSLLLPVRFDSSISQWEYFTFRIGRTIPKDSSTLQTLQIDAIRNLDNGVAPNPAQLRPEGVLATLQFHVTSDRTKIGTSPDIGFCLLSYGDNTICSESDPNRLFTPDTSRGQILYKSGYDTLNCPRRYSLSPVLELRGGWIRIVEPHDSGDSVIIDNPGARGVNTDTPVAAMR